MVIRYGRRGRAGHGGNTGGREGREKVMRERNGGKPWRKLRVIRIQ